MLSWADAVTMRKLQATMQQNEFYSLVNIFQSCPQFIQPKTHLQFPGLMVIVALQQSIAAGLVRDSTPDGSNSRFFEHRSSCTP